MKKDIVYSVLKTALLATGSVHGVHAAVNVFDTSYVIPITISSVSDELKEDPMALLELIHYSVPSEYNVEVVNSEELFGCPDMFKQTYYSDSKTLFNAYTKSSGSLNMLPVGLAAIKLMLRGFISRYTDIQLDATEFGSIQVMCDKLQRYVSLLSYSSADQYPTLMNCEYMTNCGMSSMLYDKKDAIYRTVCRVWEDLEELYTTWESDYAEEPEKRKFATTKVEVQYILGDEGAVKVSPELFNSLDQRLRESNLVACMYGGEA